MSKDTIKVNMNIYDIPILVEQLKKLEQENKQLKEDKKKAIEYIKEHSEMTDLQICGIENVLAFRGSATKLLEILGDKEYE